MKLYRNWIINEVARAGEHTNERTYVRTDSHTYLRDRPYIPPTTLLCEGIKILILRQTNLSKHCLLRFLCLNIMISPPHMPQRTSKTTTNKNSAECCVAPALCLHIKNSMKAFVGHIFLQNPLVRSHIFAILSDSRGNHFGWSICEKIVIASCKDLCDSILV